MVLSVLTQMGIASDNSYNPNKIRFPARSRSTAGSAAKAEIVEIDEKGAGGSWSPA